MCNLNTIPEILRIFLKISERGRREGEKDIKEMSLKRLKFTKFYIAIIHIKFLIFILVESLIFIGLNE